MDVARVDEKAAALAKYEHRIHAVYRIDEKHETAREAEIPKGFRNDTAPSLLAGKPLNDEAHRKHGLRRKPDRQPHHLGCGYACPPSGQIRQIHKSSRSFARLKARRSVLLTRDVPGPRGVVTWSARL